MSNIHENTIALSLSVHKFGNSKGVDKSTLQQVMVGVSDTAIEQYLHTTRKLIQCDEYQMIGTLDNAFGAWLKARSLPSYYRKGIYLIPVANVDNVEQRIQDYKLDRETFVEQLGQVWESAWSKSQQETSYNFGYLDCPPWELVKGKFYIEYFWLDLGVPGKLNYFSQKAWQTAQAQAQERLQQMEYDIAALLRAEACEKTQTLLDRLNGLADGTTKRFASSHVSGLLEWCREFIAGRNVTSDSELEHRAKELQEVLELICDNNGEVPVAVLRNSTGFREQITEKIQVIGNALLELTEDKPVRVLVLED